METQNVRTSHLSHDEVKRARERMWSSLPLALLDSGARVQVVSFRCGRLMQHRLTDMGLSVGSEITVISRGTSGSSLICIGDTRVVIGGGMAHKIIVSSY
jgi:ferrous iron transport protein A